MRYSKQNLIDLVARIMFPEYGDMTLVQINMEQTLKGEKTLDISVDSLKTIEMTSWLFGFVSNHIGYGKLQRMFLHGLRRNWFYHENDDDYNRLLLNFVSDIFLFDKDFFLEIAEYSIKRKVNDESSRKIFRLAFNSGLMNIEWNELIELKKFYGI